MKKLLAAHLIDKIFALFFIGALSIGGGVVWYTFQDVPVPDVEIVGQGGIYVTEADGSDIQKWDVTLTPTARTVSAPYQKADFLDVMADERVVHKTIRLVSLYEQQKNIAVIIELENVSYNLDQVVFVMLTINSIPIIFDTIGSYTETAFRQLYTTAAANDEVLVDISIWLNGADPLCNNDLINRSFDARIVFVAY